MATGGAAVRMKGGRPYERVEGRDLGVRVTHRGTSGRPKAGGAGGRVEGGTSGGVEGGCTRRRRTVHGSVPST